MCVCLCTCVDTYPSTRHTSNSSIWKFEKLRQGDPVSKEQPQNSPNQEVAVKKKMSSCSSSQFLLITEVGVGVLYPLSTYPAPAQDSLIVRNQ